MTNFNHYIQILRLQKQGISQSQIDSSTDNQKTNRDDRAKQLEKEIRILKEKASNKMKNWDNANNINQEITEQPHCQSYLQNVKGTYVPTRG